MAERFLKADENKDEEAKSNNRLKLKQINDEMRDMLMMAGDTRGAIKEMNEAYAGEQEFDYVNQVTKSGKHRVKKVARKRQ